ncbi:Protein O-linked-mannose beta-1,4-N-acetylglucosaminyltransferase 2 [Striga asiatica]|uniref:Protein O-linked-mannose beta-1,4-N-acetylglucosaminyltransferase 2 n=1 Tax=Striga asiatica TaxID=4170 RepID=A0A5A7PUA3_STRAF|nr:Protein O-linked-mannose beta-1,4-N-acetylglucosaminyltransferase 2 [Striga asiatica]
MEKPSSELDQASNPTRAYPRKSNQNISLSSPKLPIYLLTIFVILFILFQIHSLQTSQWAPLTHKWDKIHSCLPTLNSKAEDSKSTTSRLRQSVTFLPLKDLRFSDVPMQGHTWFMSSLYDTHEHGEVQYQEFPSEPSGGRILCLRGRDSHDGSWNSYALAWPDALPENATLSRGLTFISNNHYDYHNIWHGLSAMTPFVAWHARNQCRAPERWILFHWGELRTSMAPWVRTMLEAVFGRPLDIETFEGSGPTSCFKGAVVMRHNEGGMSRERRMEAYDLMRCKSRMYCGLGLDEKEDKGLQIGMTMLMRDGARSFRNPSAVVRIFERECRKVSGCRLTVSYPHNLTFCEQVELMSRTDIVISAHGAQLSNMILMDRESSVMELFPKGWRELAGVGQYVHHWLASWSGMRHEGAWRDPVGDTCPYPEDDRRCMSVFKNGRIGYNESYFSEWATRVLSQTSQRKKALIMNNASGSNPVKGLCGCN